MPNINVIDRLVGAPSPAQGSKVIAPYVPAGTSATVLTNQLGGAAVLNVGNAPSQPTGAQTYGSGWDGFPFKIRITAKVTTKASNNVTIAIQQGNTTTVTSGNNIASTGAVAVNTTSGTISLEAWVLWDSTLQKLCGWQWGQVSNTVTSASIVALTNSVSVTTQAALQFVPVVTMSDTTTGTTMTITEFVAMEAS